MGIYDTFASFQETMTTPLLPNETVIKSGMATIKQKLELITYNTFLTNIRIVFEVNKSSQEFSDDVQDLGAMVGATAATDSVVTGIAGADIGTQVGSKIHNNKIQSKYSHLELELRNIADIKDISFKAFGLIPTSNKGLEFVTNGSTIKVWFGSHRPEWREAIQGAIAGNQNITNAPQS